MTVTRGKSHVFLGMKISFTGDDTFSILMDDHLQKTIDEFGEKLVATTTTLAKKDLFDVNPDSKLLGEGKAKTFHSVSAKLLYICTKARLDVKLGVAFLCTRVSKSTEQDWGKLRIVLQYIKGTIDMPRILGVDDMTSLVAWVDTSYAVYPDMRSHTGGCMSFGTGVLMPKSMKQKLNIKSRTEAETVGGSDYVPNVI